MIIEIKVHPKSKKSEVVKGELWEAWVKSAPEKGKANYEVIKLISSELNIPKSKITIISGSKSKSKCFRVDI